MRHHLFDLQTDFFRPVWRRVAVVAVCLGWALFEFITGAPFWGIIFGALGVYSLQQLFFGRWPDDPGTLDNLRPPGHASKPDTTGPNDRFRASDTDESA